MKQVEMSRYLKFITIGVGVLFLVFVIWFLPSVMRDLVYEAAGSGAYWGACTFVWVTAVPCLMCLWRFWGICVRIGKDQSFSRKNAVDLKKMSHYMLVDCMLYTVLLAGICVEKWYEYHVGLIFGVLLILFLCMALVIICAALSHLVYKASKMQDDQDLTI